MGFSKKQEAVIYIERNKFYFYSQEYGKMLTFDFQKHIISDLEVLNREEFTAALKLFIETNKITPSHIIILLSDDILFEKEQPIQGKDIEESELQKFLDTIPFENIGYRIIHKDTGLKIIATNADVYESLKDALEQHGCMVDAVIPISLLPKKITTLDAPSVKYIFQKSDEIKQYSLLIKQEHVNKTQEHKATTFFKKNKPTIVIVFFIFSILLLIFALYTYFKSSQKQLSTPPLINTNSSSTYIE